jgi:hypothetical protein
MVTAEQQQLFTFEQLSQERWGGTPSIWTLRRLADDGQLKTVYIGARRLIPLSEVLRVEQYGLGTGRKRRQRHEDTLPGGR